MKGIDYSKQIANERTNMQEAVVKNRQAADKRIEDNENRNEYIQNKQRNNFIEDRAELEKSYQKNLENVKEKTNAALEAKNDTYNKRMEEERKNFKNAHETKSKDFDRRLDDIKSSYDKSHKSQKENNEELSSTNKNRYSKNINDLRANQEQQLAKYQEKMKGAGGDLKEQYNREREQLVRKQEDHVNAVRKNEVHKQNDLKEKVTRDIKLSNDVNAAEKHQIQKYSDDKLKRLNKHHTEHSENISRDYTQKSDEYATSRQKDAIHANRESQDKALEMQRGFDDKLRAIELEKRRRDNGSSEFADVNNEQMGLKDQDVYQNKINNLKTALKDTQKEYEIRTKQDSNGYKQTLKNEKTEATVRKDRLANDMNADKIVTVAKERKTAEKAVANQQYLNRIEKEAFEGQIMHERNTSNDRISNLKENFHKAMTKMEEKMQVSVEDVTKMSNEDKAIFVKNLNERRSNEIFELKRDFSQSMDKTIQNYEQRLANAERENNLIKMNMSQKVENIMDQTDKKLDSERTIYDERRKAELRDSQIALDQREHKLRTEMNTVIVNYQRKLDKMQVDNDTKMKLITNNYENRLKELNTLKGKDLAAKETTHQMEIQRLKSAFDDEKSRIVNAYENKISGITAGHEERMLQLDEYKKLS